MLSTAFSSPADCPSKVQQVQQVCSGPCRRHDASWKLPLTCAAGGTGTHAERTG